MSGCLSLMVANTQGIGAQLTNQNVNSSGSLSRTAGYRLNTSGIVESLVQAAYTTLETWLLLGASSAYECRATLNSGALSSGTTGSWLALSSSREWTCVDSIVDGSPAQANLTMEIRNASTLVVQDSATITLYAERS